MAPQSKSTNTSTNSNMEMDIVLDTTSSTNRSVDEILSFLPTMERSHYPLNSEVNTFLNLKIKAGEFSPDKDKKRKPLDLQIVLDKSGSMRGQKLNLCKATIEFLASQLDENDTLGLTLFDSTVKKYDLMNMNKNGKDKIESILDRTNAGTCTNLSGGLFEGLNHLISYTKENDFARMERIQSVFLLTDGHANEGICDPTQLINQLDDELSANRDIKVYTFGYGNDHSVNLLQRIGECGHGGYYFIEKNEDVVGTFSDCLGGLLSVVAQEISIDFTTSTNMVITPIPGQKAINVNSLIEGKSYAIQLTDIFAGEEKDILFEIKLPSLGGDTSIMDWNAAKFRFDYMDMRTDPSSNIQMEENLIIPRVIDADLEKLTLIVSPEVTMNRLRLRTVQALREADNLAKGNQLEKARELLMQVKSNVVEARDSLSLTQSSLNTNNPNQILSTFNGLIQDLDDCISSMANRNRYRSHGAYFIQATSNEQVYQRSCKATSRFENCSKSKVKSVARKMVASSKYIKK